VSSAIGAKIVLLASLLSIKTCGVEVLEAEVEAEAEAEAQVEPGL